MILLVEPTGTRTLTPIEKEFIEDARKENALRKIAAPHKCR